MSSTITSLARAVKIGLFPTDVEGNDVPFFRDSHRFHNGHIDIGHCPRAEQITDARQVSWSINSIFPQLILSRMALIRLKRQPFADNARFRHQPVHLSEICAGVDVNFQLLLFSFHLFDEGHRHDFRIT